MRRQKRSNCLIDLLGDFIEMKGTEERVAQMVRLCSCAEIIAYRECVLA